MGGELDNMDQEPAPTTVIRHRCHQPPKKDPNLGNFILVIPLSCKIPAAPCAQPGEQLPFGRTSLEKPLLHLTSFALTMTKVATPQRPGPRTSTRIHSVSVQKETPQGSHHPQSRWISPHFARGPKHTAPDPSFRSSGILLGVQGETESRIGALQLAMISF